MTSLGYTYIGVDTACAITTAHDTVSATLQFGDIAQNGGTTALGINGARQMASRAPLKGNPAINGGNPAGCTEVGISGTPALTVDADNTTRPVSTCDAGPIETLCGNGVVDTGEDCDPGIRSTDPGVHCVVHSR